MTPATPEQIAAAVVVAVLGALVVAVTGWIEARRGERHAVERALAAEREERRAAVRAGKIEVATEAVRQAAMIVADQEMARHLQGWDGLRRACRMYDQTIEDADTGETVNPARM